MNTKLTRCRTQLLLKNPFFGTLALKLKIVEGKTDTMATDGYHLYYDEAFVEKITPDELTGVVAHELMHCALLHMYRRQDRDYKKWNVACDYAINVMLIDQFKFTLPAEGLLDRHYANMSAEEIYSRLPDSENEPSWGTFTDGSSSNGATTQEQEIEWAIALKQAADAAKAAGQDIGGLSELIKIAEAKVNWREQLNRLIGSVAKSDFTWMRPDPAYLHRNLVIPTLNSPSIGHLTFAIDTSGSVCDRQLSQFLGELNHVLENVHFEGVTVLECDAKIQKVTEYDREDTITPKVHGRGGTRFSPVFEYIKQHPTDALIYFTDMYPCEAWPDKPDIPVFWARTTSVDAPYGEHIDVYTAV